MEQHSQEIDKLIAALPAMQKVLKSPKKTSENPHFKSKFADLAEDWDACREALATNGFSIVQVTEPLDGKVYLRSILFHASGQWISGLYPIEPERLGPQAFKSAVTYARRTALEAIIGLAAEDDDGSTAAHLPPKRQPDRVIVNVPLAEQATLKENELLQRAKREAGVSNEWVNAKLFSMYGAKRVSDLTKSQVMRLIGEIELDGKKRVSEGEQQAAEMADKG